MATGAEVQREAAERRKAMAALLSSPPGQDLLKELAAEFDPDDVTGKDSQETAYNLGARHVYRMLLNLSKESHT